MSYFNYLFASSFQTNANAHLKLLSFGVPIPHIDYSISSSHLWGSSYSNSIDGKSLFASCKNVPILLRRNNLAG